MMVVAPLPVLALLVLIQMLVVATVMMGFDDPLMIVGIFIVVPMMIVAAIRIIDAIVCFAREAGRCRG